MSTKQTVIFTFMILFLAGSLFAIGAWFQYSSQLDAKLKMIDALETKKLTINAIIEGPSANPKLGLRYIVTNPVEGLKRQLEDERKRADKMSNETDGSKQREVLYDKKGEEIEPKWKGAADKWKTTFDDWKKLNGDIDGAFTRLKEQNAKKNEETAKARTERDTEENNEDVARKEIVANRKTMSDEIGTIRAAHEEVLDKISNVTREIRKSKAVTPQAKVLAADEDMHTVSVDIGAIHGVRKGMQFDLYSGIHPGLLKKGRIEISRVNPSSSLAVILPPPVPFKQDPVTGWVPPDPSMKYSIYVGGGPDETEAQELVKPKTKQDRIDAYQLKKIEDEQGLEEVDRILKERDEPSSPPVEIGKGFEPIRAGDWINNPDFVPVITDAAYQQKSVDELRAMEDVNLSPLTFYFTDSVRAYRREFLKRLAERNHCKTAEAVSSDVDYIVTSAGSTRADLLAEKLQSTKDKEEVSSEIKNQRKTLQALLDGKKIGAHVVAEDEMEAFFAKRQRKAELLRGKTIQPGQHTFFVAGETKDRSVDQLQHYITDHGGVMAPSLDGNVDYVVVGGGLDQPFFDKIKKLGLRIIREDELPRFFGSEDR